MLAEWSRLETGANFDPEACKDLENLVALTQDT